MTSTPTGPSASITTTLAPSYKLPITMVLLSLPLLFIQLAVGIVWALFSLFLLYQTTAIRLTFTSVALEVSRNDNLLKTFPYADWESWKIFWPAVPILFYFKEINSIHFVPVLYDPQQLREQLERHSSERAV
ncbi:DUF3119 family protein [cf. Phormidesmis sp. LEGE 11477]|uniref:DUF3119 family protein n=1 Tax=cf. Phormidesmis sp. LEGE 11477 TaxID=1828680 RepID=UPI00187F25F9|nr:DUF3119 family protein [cf. Phormidesmis sp. LEGE 11477]